MRKSDRKSEWKSEWQPPHTLRCVIFALALLLPAAALADDRPVQLAAEAVEANPSLAAMRARTQALQRQAEVAGAWSDPMIAVEYSNVPVTSLGLSDHPMSGLQLKATQTIRPPSWSRLQRELGGLQADVSGLATAEAALQLRASVERTWWMLARTRLLEAVTQAHLARAEELLSAARSRYETGILGQHAVLRLEVLRDQLTDELNDFTRTERELTAALGEALSRAPGALPTPAEVEPLAPPPPADWQALAVAHRPLLSRIDTEQEAAQTAASLARVEALPDVSVWAGYRVRTIETDTDPGTDLVSIGLGVPIPAGSARRARGAEAAALERVQAASLSHDAALDNITAEMDSIFARWERAADKATTYRDLLIPGARSVLETTQADFSVGRADFASLFEAEVALLTLERAFIIAATDTHLQHTAATANVGISPIGATP